jgi:membrane protease subunit HflK
MALNSPRTIVVQFPPGLARWASLAPFLLAALWLVLTSWYTIPAESVGVVLRFGKFDAIREPGLHFKLPFGIDEVQIVAVKRQLKLEFGFATNGASNPRQFGDDQDREKNMVTGDLNTALVEWVVQYRLDDPKRFLFSVRHPEDTLRDLSESIMREIIGDRTVDEVITIGRQDIENNSLIRLREGVKEFQLGIAVDQVQLKNVNPPREVQASFNEVNRAKQDRENMMNIANGEYNKVVPRASGEAEQKISVAEGYKLKRVNEALGDVSAFNAVLAEYLKAPEVTRTRIYLETMAEVLPQVRDRIIVDDKITQLLPMLPGAGRSAGEVRK